MELLDETKCFEEACDKLANSKLALVDKKIAELLSVVASSERIYSLIAECMINFNYDNEMKRATRRMGMFTLPKETYTSIAFVFSLFDNFDKKKINLFKFIDTYYVAETQNEKFIMFCNSILASWKDLVVSSIAGVKIKTKQPTKQNKLDVSVVSRITFLLKDLSMCINTKKNKRVNVVAVNKIIDALLEALELNNITIITAFVIALEEICKIDKVLSMKIATISDVTCAIKGE
ncbi:MAG: hypothetical protein RR334_01455 [Clostridia bacterium]